MIIADILTAIGLGLALMHFTVPLAYYMHLRKKWFYKPWNVKKDYDYRPKICIVIPTYKEADRIWLKLNNIYEQDYPRDKMHIIVVDSASPDNTVDVVRKWASNHSDVELTILEEPIRRGLVHALNYALKYVPEDCEIVIFTDADAYWSRDTLRNVIAYFADTSIGAVTASILPNTDEARGEYTYREYYNVIRISESKMYSTPIHNGVLVAFRYKLLKVIGGLPTYTGNDDSTPASLIAFMGYRAIQVDDVVVSEHLLEKGQVMRKIRRAQHLILHFLHTKRYAKKLGIYKRTSFDKIWNIEAYLHLINPWLLLLATLLLVMQALHDLIALALLILGAILLTYKPYRTWIINQIILIVATFRNIVTKDIIWQK